jgi:hypothetical protein
VSTARRTRGTAFRSPPWAEAIPVEDARADVVISYVDYWGTIVHTFDVHDPHTEPVVTGHSVTDTSASPHSGDAPWGVVHDPPRHEEL